MENIKLKTGDTTPGLISIFTGFVEPELLKPFLLAQVIMHWSEKLRSHFPHILIFGVN